MRFKLQEQQEYEVEEPEYDEQGDEGQEHMEDYQECRNEDEYVDEDQDQYPVNRLFPVQFTGILKFSSIGIRHLLRRILDYLESPLLFLHTILNILYFLPPGQ